MWLILAIDSTCGGYLFLLESTAVDLRLIGDQLQLMVESTVVDLWLIQAAFSL
jgi:hypothetical protein